MKCINCLFIWCMAVMLFACQEEDMPGQSSGKTGFLISLTDGTKVSASRATPGELVATLPIEPADFLVTIMDHDTQESVYMGNVSEEPIEVKAGVYDLIAVYGENPVLSLDAPYFEGKVESEEVKGGATTDVEIPCKVANSLLSVVYDNTKKSFDDIYSNYYVEVKVEDESVSIEDISKSAYFKAGSVIEVIFHGTLKEGGEEKSVPLDLDNVKNPLEAGDHLKLTLMPELDKYDIPLSVTAAEVVTATWEETIPVSWLPKPKVSAEGFDENNTLTFVETEARQARLNLGLSSALQDMKLKFNFEDAQFASLQKDKEYLLSDAEDKAAMEEALGITLPEIGATEASIDLSGVVSRMQTNAGATVNNSIEVDVMANDRWSSEDENVNRVYKLVCNKPVFRIDAYPGNIWTKEFTVNALREEQVESGNFSAISESITYQYSTDQSEWFALSDGMRQDKLKPGTTYYIRGLYRGVIPGEMAEVTTYPEIPLKNGGLEGAKVSAGDDSNVLRGSVYEWDGWATLNNMSTPSGATAYSFNSRSGCRPTSDSYKGDAVRVITLGYGIGGFAKPKKAMHSKLYLGVSADGDGNGIVNGIEYKSRPSHLTFWYKCISNKGNDESLVQVQLLHDDVVLGEASFTTSSQNTYIMKTLEINYSEYSSNLSLSPNKLQILFQSGIKEPLNIADLKSFIPSWNTVDKTADATFRGNELFVDEVSLVYDK